jgi:hypothetical protein
VLRQPSSRRSCGGFASARCRSRPLRLSNSDFARSCLLPPRARVITCYLSDLETPDAGENGVKFALDPEGPLVICETHGLTPPDVELVLLREGNPPGGSITLQLAARRGDPRLFEPLRSAA